MKNLKYTTLFVLSLFFTTTQLLAQGALDKQVFNISIVEKNRMGDPKKLKGDISFNDGKIDASIIRENDFSKADYTTTEKSGMVTKIITFKGESEGKKDIIEWEGTVNGDEIEGTATRKRKGTIRTIYEFKGTLK